MLQTYTAPVGMWIAKARGMMLQRLNESASAVVSVMASLDRTPGFSGEVSLTVLRQREPAAHKGAARAPRRLCSADGARSMRRIIATARADLWIHQLWAASARAATAAARPDVGVRFAAAYSQ